MGNLSEGQTNQMSEFRNSRYVELAQPLKETLCTEYACRVLDLCCGYPMFPDWFAPGCYIGVDIDPKAIELSTARWPSQKFICENVEQATEDVCVTHSHFDMFFLLGLVDQLTQCSELYPAVLKLMDHFHPKHILIERAFDMKSRTFGGFCEGDFGPYTIHSCGQFDAKEGKQWSVRQWACLRRYEIR